MTTKALHKTKVAIMVISRLFNSLILMYNIHLQQRLLFHETLIVNEAQVPPTGLLCEV